MFNFGDQKNKSYICNKENWFRLMELQFWLNRTFALRVLRSKEVYSGSDSSLPDRCAESLSIFQLYWLALGKEPLDSAATIFWGSS